MSQLVALENLDIVLSVLIPVTAHLDQQNGESPSLASVMESGQCLCVAPATGCGRRRTSYGESVSVIVLGRRNSKSAARAQVSAAPLARKKPQDSLRAADERLIQKPRSV